MRLARSIAAKIAGLIGILPCCVLNYFSHKGINICPICAASLSHHTLCMGKFGLVSINANSNRCSCIGYNLTSLPSITKQKLSIPMHGFETTHVETRNRRLFCSLNQLAAIFVRFQVYNDRDIFNGLNVPDYLSPQFGHVRFGYGYGYWLQQQC